MPKTVLFVTYGGGHAQMVTPVIRELEGRSDIRVEAIALTTAGPIFKRERIPYKGFKHFIRPDDRDAIRWGKKLAGTHHNPEGGIEEDESIAYLGLSYWDLVVRFGKAEAARLWETRERHAFLPLTVMERIIGQIKPDLVVTTNSPRSECAAIQVAKGRRIPTLSMVDLFGLGHFYPLEADYITVLCNRVIENLEQETHRPRASYLITGNPAFDHALDYDGPIDYAWRRQHFPKVPEVAKTLLWIDIPAHRNLQKNEILLRDDHEVVRDLNTLATAAQRNDCMLLVRPHPSQRRGLYHEWLKTAPQHVMYAGDVPLYPLLNAVDLVCTYTSTVSIEALLMRRRVVQLKYLPGKSGLPLDEWKMAWIAKSPDEVSECIHDALTDDAEWERMKGRIEEMLPQEKAAPKIAAHIERILGCGQQTIAYTASQRPLAPNSSPNHLITLNF